MLKIIFFYLDWKIEFLADNRLEAFSDFKPLPCFYYFFQMTSFFSCFLIFSPPKAIFFCYNMVAFFDQLTAELSTLISQKDTFKKSARKQPDTIINLLY